MAVLMFNKQNKISLSGNSNTYRNGQGGNITGQRLVQLQLWRLRYPNLQTVMIILDNTESIHSIKYREYNKGGRARRLYGTVALIKALISFLGLAINSHQAEMPGIDQQQTKRWLKLSDAETAYWQLNSSWQKGDSGDYWREANNLSSI